MRRPRPSELALGLLVAAPAAVVDIYDRGGGRGAGLRVPNQTLPARPLRLTRRERRDFVAFLGAVSDARGP